MTPLERAARAVRDEIAYPHGDGTFVVEGGFREDQFFRDVARAVIVAIREPSEAMEAAWVGNSPGGSTAKRDWQAMLDALMEEGE